MTTPIEPEQQTEESSVESDTITEAPQTPDVDEIKKNYNQLFQDQQAEIRRLQAQVNTPVYQAPPERDVEQDKQLLFDDPRRLLREEIAEQNKPIIDFMNTFQKQQAIDMFKSQMRSDAMGRFKYLDKVSDFFDRAVQSLNFVNADSVVAAYNLALGNYVSNGGNLNDVPAPTQTNSTVPIPPHIKSAAPVRTTTHQNAKPVLSEAERKIARINNMSDEDFVKFRDMPAGDVAKMETK